jgi:hypothetical protein
VLLISPQVEKALLPTAGVDHHLHHLVASTQMPMVTLQHADKEEDHMVEAVTAEVAVLLLHEVLVMGNGETVSMCQVLRT